MRRFIWLILVILSFIGQSFGPLVKPKVIETKMLKDSINENKNDTRLDSIAKKHSIVGMSLGIIKKGSKNYSFHYGLRNLTLNLPVNEQTLFRVASISKIITAIAIMQLVEQDDIQLDKDVSNYLKQGVRNKFFEDTPMTVRMLLSHTSSINDGSDYDDFIASTYTEKQVPVIYELLNSNANVWINKKPGTYFNYSSLNYGILATIIENVSGLRFDHYISKHILEPLIIKGGFNVSQINEKENISVLYRGTSPQADNYQNIFPENRDYPAAINGLYYSPQGGLRISMTDLSKLLQMLMNYGSYENVQILKKESVITMESEQWLNNGNNGNTYHNLFLSWGLGLQKTTVQKERDYMMPILPFIGHHGDAYGL